MEKASGNDANVFEKVKCKYSTRQCITKWGKKSKGVGPVIPKV